MYEVAVGLPCMGLGAASQSLELVYPPAFIVPYCYFAYRRSIAGLVATVLALGTSMFWFPVPKMADPRIVSFLEAERQWLTGDWTLPKILLTALVPAFFYFLARAFWMRSWWMGLAIVNLSVAAKVVWSFYAGERSAWSLVPPALIGAVVVNVFVVLLARRYRSRHASVRPGSQA